MYIILLPSFMHITPFYLVDDGRVWLQGSEQKEIRKYNCSLPYLSKHRKKKRENPFFFSLFPFTQSLPHFQGATVNFVVI